MKIKGIIDEDFTNFKIPSMFIGLGTCNWKCCIENNIPIAICQNSKLAKQKDIDISANEIFRRYITNPITSAIVIGGLEPFTQKYDIIDLIKCFRVNFCNDYFVVYTGFYEYEIQDEIEILKQYPNIILKTGRYIPNQKSHFDEILGIYLASDNQHGIKIN